MEKITARVLIKMKAEADKIVSLTAYDYSFAALVERAGVEVVLVGDSLGMVMQGEENTLPVTLEQMIYHSKCVARGCSKPLLVVDMPFMSYQVSVSQALENAGRLIKEGAADMVKLEGGARVCDAVRAMVDCGIPVCGHLGLTPQSVNTIGGYRVQGRDEKTASRILEDARLLQLAGASLLVLEAVPVSLANQVTQELDIPTIGIGAGPGTDGQVLVLQDALGLYPKPSPKFSRNFMTGNDSIEAAVRAYVHAVKAGQFPTADHSFE